MDVQIENYDQNKLRPVRKLANRQYFWSPKNEIDL